MFELEKELKDWKLDAETLAEKYDFVMEKDPLAKHVYTKPEKIPFGGEEFYGEFHFLGNRTEIDLIPVRNILAERSDTKGETARYEFSMEVMKKMFGEGEEFRNIFTHGTKWRTENFDAFCSMHNILSEDDPDIGNGGCPWFVIKPIRAAMHSFFEKQKELYKEVFDTLPVVPFTEDNTGLFTGEPDEEMYIQWRPALADDDEIEVEGLGRVLTEFYCSYYYCQLDGFLKDTLYYFPQVTSREDAIRIANFAIGQGKELFPGRNLAAVAQCDIAGADGMTLLYDQDDGSMFIWDYDSGNIYLRDFSLTELLSEMEPVL